MKVVGILLAFLCISGKTFCEKKGKIHFIQIGWKMWAFTRNLKSRRFGSR